MELERLRAVASNELRAFGTMLENAGVEPLEIPPTMPKGGTP